MNKLKNVSTAGPLLLLLTLIIYNTRGVADIWVHIPFWLGLGLTVLLLILYFDRIKASLRLRSTQYGANSLVMVLLVVGILGMVNFLAKKYNERWDLTSAKLYSLSDQTEKLMTRLKNEVEVIHFDKEPNSTLNDLMKEYQSVNPSALTYRRVDPQNDPGLAKKYEVSRFGAIVVVFGDKHEKVEAPREEDLTNTILKVTREQDKVIYFTKGHNEADIDNNQDERGYAQAKGAIGDQNYKVKSVNLAESRSIPEDCSALVIAGPKVALLPTETALIDEYIDSGGKVLLLTDPDSDAGIDALLKKWKISVEDDIVVDSSGLGQLFGMGPAAPLVASYESHPITKDLANTMSFFPEARSLKTIENAESDFNSTVLFRTSERSWGEKNLVAGSAEFNEGVDIEGPVALGVVSTRSVSPTLEEIDGDQGETKKKKEDVKTFGKESRVVVIGDSDFANNTFLRHQRNGDLFLNTVSWLAEDEDLISVRPKDPENRSVQMTSANSRTLFWLTMVMMPGAALISGIIVWTRRK